MTVRLTDEQIDAGLAALSEWKREGDTIVRTFEFDSFRDAIGFVTRVADLAEEAGHHPDLDIRYSKVTARLSTHDAGGLTALDVALAVELDGAA